MWTKARELIVGVVKDVISDDDVQKHIEALLARLLKNHVAPLIPVAVQTAVPIAVAATIKQIKEQFPGSEELIDSAVDTVAVVNQTRAELDRVIPDIDFGIPALDSFLDIWRPKKPGAQP